VIGLDKATKESRF